MTPDAEVELPAPAALDLRATFLLRGLGRYDPCQHVGTDHVVRATITAAGPVTIEVRRAAGVLRARAWGEGAAWAISRVDSFLGLHREPPAIDFDSTPIAAVFDEPTRRRLARDQAHLRGSRHGVALGIVPALVGIILQQKVTFVDAAGAHRDLVRRFGAPAPGPYGGPPESWPLARGARASHGMRLPIAPALLAKLPYYELHPAGVERRRAEVLRGVARRARHLEALREEPAARVREVCDALPGVGPWTRESLLATALGDVDAVSPGDYHLPNTLAWYLAREERADDARMFALLEPFRPARGRIVAAATALGVHAPRRGPKSARSWLRDRRRRS